MAGAEQALKHQQQKTTILCIPPPSSPIPLLLQKRKGAHYVTHQPSQSLTGSQLKEWRGWGGTVVQRGLFTTTRGERGRNRLWREREREREERRRKSFSHRLIHNSTAFTRRAADHRHHGNSQRRRETKRETKKGGLILDSFTSKLTLCWRTLHYNSSICDSVTWL